jgi:membrane-bound inhibitor of C-type lysozyme
MRAIITLAVMALVPSGMAHAQMSLTLPLGPDATVAVEKYRCDDGRDVQVQYINAGPNSLAMISPEGQDLIFVNVISGSGARYVSGMWEWWSKGSDATLLDGNLDPVQCQVIAE